MRTFHSIKIDKRLPREIILNAISKEFGLTIVSPAQLIGDEIQKLTDKSKDLEKELASGELLQIATIERVIKENVVANSYSGILFIEYPRTKKQLDSLKSLMLNLGFDFKNIWYFKNKHLADSGYWEIENEMIKEIELIESYPIDELQIRQLVKSSV